MPSRLAALCALVLVMAVPRAVRSQSAPEDRLDRLERETRLLRDEVRTLKVEVDAASWRARIFCMDFVLLGFCLIVMLSSGFGCARWATNTGRNAALWFLLGMFFHMMAVIAIVVIESDGRRYHPGKTSRSPLKSQPDYSDDAIG